MNCNKCNKKATLHSLTYYDSWDYGFCPVCFTRLSNKQILIKIDEIKIIPNTRNPVSRYLDYCQRHHGI